MTKKAIAVVSALLAAALLTGCLIFPATGATTNEKIAALREKNKQLQSEIDNAEEQMKALKSDISQRKAYAEQLSGQITDLQSQIDVLDQSIDAIQSKIDVLMVDIEEKTNLITALEGQVADAQVEIDDCNRRIEETYEHLKQRMRSIYINGSVSSLELLFSSSDFTAYLESLELMDSMAKHDDALIKSIQADIAALHDLQTQLEASKQKEEEARVALEEAKSDLEASRAEVEENKAVVAANKQAVKDKWDDVQQVISSLDEKSAEYQALVNAYTRQMNEATAEIDKLLAAQVQAGRLSTGTGAVSGAGFIWPTPYSNIFTTTEFGHNGHGGLDINVVGDENYDKAAVSVASGTVVTATYHYSYGNYVVVDHGNGLSTLYAHLYRIDVSSGQSVSQGQQVGIIGNTGNSFGAHLHFEVRVNGARRNPRNYLP